MTDKCSCGVIERLAKDYDWPFFCPLLIDKENHNLKVGDWSIKLLCLTASGNISKKSTPSIVMNFCPFCGGWLVERESEAA